MNATTTDAAGRPGTIWVPFRETADVTGRENAVTKCDGVFIARGVQDEGMVGAAGFEPAAARV